MVRTMHPLPEVSSKAAVRGLSALVSRAAFCGERVIVTRNGRPVAALVPIADLAELARHEAQEGTPLAAHSAPQLEAAPLPAPAPPQPQPPPSPAPGIVPQSAPGAPRPEQPSGGFNGFKAVQLEQAPGGKQP
jgi:prevent-host-death family protein